MARHVACTGDRRGVCTVVVGNLRGRVYLDELGVNCMMILLYMLNRSVGSAWARLIWHRTGTADGMDKKCDLLGYYATSSGNFLRTFRDNPSAPSSGGFSKLFDS